MGGFVERLIIVVMIKINVYSLGSKQINAILNSHLAVYSVNGIGFYFSHNFFLSTSVWCKLVENFNLFHDCLSV